MDVGMKYLGLGGGRHVTPYEFRILVKGEDVLLKGS